MTVSFCSEKQMSCTEAEGFDYLTFLRYFPFMKDEIFVVLDTQWRNKWKPADQTKIFDAFYKYNTAAYYPTCISIER